MSMFARLFLLLGLLSSISLGIVAALLKLNSDRLATQLSAVNEQAGQAVSQEARASMTVSLTTTHPLIVREKARRVQSFLNNIADTVQLEATLTRQFLSDKGASTSTPPLFEANELTRLGKANPALHKSFISVQPYSIYHLAPRVSLRQTQQTITRLRRLGAFFANAQHQVHGCDSTYFGGEQGFIQGYPGGLTLFKPSYDPRLRPWYRLAVDQPSAGAINWIVDKDRDGKTLFLTCSRSVTLPGEKKPIGVVAMDVKWPDVVAEMFDVGKLKVSKAILVDSSGLVRVSAVYDPSSTKSKPVFDTKDALSTPPVTSTPGFASVMAYISQPHDPTKSFDTDDIYGIYWQGMEHGKVMEEASDVFLYASLSLTAAPGTFRSSPGISAQSPSDNWYYIVRLPMSPLKSPIVNMRRKMDSANVKYRAIILSTTRNSTVIVLEAIAATLLVALLVAYVAARATSRPLIQMAEVARGVGQGNLDQQAIETSGGEIGEMGRAINAMISGLRQRNLLQETFGRYTAPSVVEEVLKRGGVQLGGVKSNATIFFSDLVGFTALSERTEPELLVALLNEYFDAMTKVILASEGTLDKYIGDAILAFWGHPIAHEDDAVRACRAALAQRQELYRLCDKWEAQGYPRLDMRIGIETGEVIVGDVGSELKLNYTVLGDTVNLASRLESLNKTYGTRILIGEATRQAAGDAIAVREIDLLAVAGKTRPIRVYELLGMADSLSPEQLSAYAAYDQALRAYYTRRWDEADAYLDRVIREVGPDKPCQVLHERICHHRLHPPPPDWDGRSVLTHK